MKEKNLKKFAKKLSRIPKERRIRRLMNKIISKKFDELLILSNNLSQIMNKKDREGDLILFREYLKLSKDDLMACKVLYDINLAHLAIYHLQQSVEKLSKGYGMALGYISEKDLRNRYGHITPRIFIKILQERFIQQFLKLFEHSYENGVGEVEKIFSENKLLYEMGKEIATFDKRKILIWIKTGKNIREKLREIEGEIELLVDKIDKEVKKLPQFTREERKEVHRMFVLLKSSFTVDMVSNFVMLYILSVITFPHFSSTRYPDGEIKPTAYKAGLGIVDCLEEIIGEVEYCIRFFEDFLGIKN